MKKKHKKLPQVQVTDSLFLINDNLVLKFFCIVWKWFEIWLTEKLGGTAFVAQRRPRLKSTFLCQSKEKKKIKLLTSEIIQTMFDHRHYLLGRKEEEAPRKNFRRRLWDVRKGSGREGDRVAETARPGCQLREQNPSQHVHAHLFRRIRKWRRWVFRECLVSSWKMETSLLLCFPRSLTQNLSVSHTETASRLIHLHAARTFSDTSFLRDQTR